jgi:hypothetical protein
MELNGMCFGRRVRRRQMGTRKSLEGWRREREREREVVLRIQEKCLLRSKESELHCCFKRSSVVASNSAAERETEAKEIYCRGKRDLVQRQKRPTREAKET